MAHRRQRFAQKTIGSACVSPIQQHKVDQPATLVNSSEQVLPAATDLHICLVHSPGGRAVTLIPPDSPLQLRCIAMDPAHDRRWFDLDTALLHHLRQIAIADPYLQYQRTHTRMISTGKRRRLNMDRAPRSEAPDYAKKDLF